MIGEETSLSKLSEHDWNILRNTWSRGVDWYVQKVGKRHWVPIEAFGNFPLFKTKREADEAATTLLLWEARRAERRQHETA
jgi:hypothetical protein